jgi:hypothetical protein
MRIHIRLITYGSTPLLAVAEYLQLLESSITCSNTSFVCATNTRDGVQGCCDPNFMDSCVIPKQCIASTAMAASCTDAACSSNSGIVKCTEAAAPECYRWIISYSKTIMTQHGCAKEGFTSTAMRATGQLASSIPPEQYRTATVTVLATPSDTPILTPVSGPSKPNLGAIIGGTIGGCTIISIFVIAAMLLRRRRKIALASNVQPPPTRYHDGHGNVTEYNPQGFTETMYPEDSKKWAQQNVGPVTRPDDAMPQYPGMAARQYGIVEVDGMQKPVEAPTDSIYHAQGYPKA